MRRMSGVRGATPTPRSAACSRSCRERASLGLTLRGRRDAAEHAGEDEVVNRVQGIPVRQACNAAWLEQRSLSYHAPITVTRHLELQPRAAGYLHLRPQPQQPVALHRLHTPEIERAARETRLRVAARPSHP